jgi:leader peptidase (prepilin peptidase)/N-methyltransferase
MMELIDTLIFAAVGGLLLIGAYSDFKTRTIPNVVSIGLLALGVLCAFVLPDYSVLYMRLIVRVAGGVLPATALLCLKLRYGGAGGGDIKLLATLGFMTGIYGLLPILLVASITGVAWARIKKLKHIPLAVFLFAGYIFYAALQLISIYV